jgi:hypothetical protein
MHTSRPGLRGQKPERRRRKREEKDERGRVEGSKHCYKNGRSLITVPV